VVMARCGVIEQSGTTAMASQLVEFTVDVAARNARNYSSMYQDAQHMRRTEIDYMNGYIISRASAQGLSVPTTSLLFGLIKLLEAGFAESQSRL